MSKDARPVTCEPEESQPITRSRNRFIPHMIFHCTVSPDLIEDETQTIVLYTRHRVNFFRLARDSEAYIISIYTSWLNMQAISALSFTISQHSNKQQANQNEKNSATQARTEHSKTSIDPAIESNVPVLLVITDWRSLTAYCYIFHFRSHHARGSKDLVCYLLHHLACSEGKKMGRFSYASF
jgi:hypothetical protein